MPVKLALAVGGNGVEEGDVRGEVVSVRGKVFGPQGGEELLARGVEGECEDQGVGVVSVDRHDGAYRRVSKRDSLQWSELSNGQHANDHQEQAQAIIEDETDFPCHE